MKAAMAAKANGESVSHRIKSVAAASEGGENQWLSLEMAKSRKKS